MRRRLNSYQSDRRRNAALEKSERIENEITQDERGC